MKRLSLGDINRLRREAMAGASIRAGGSGDSSLESFDGSGGTILLPHRLNSPIGETEGDVAPAGRPTWIERKWGSSTTSMTKKGPGIWEYHFQSTYGVAMLFFCTVDGILPYQPYGATAYVWPYADLFRPFHRPRERNYALELSWEGSTSNNSIDDFRLAWVDHAVGGFLTLDRAFSNGVASGTKSIPSVSDHRPPSGWYYSSPVRVLVYPSSVCGLWLGRTVYISGDPGATNLYVTIREIGADQSQRARP